MRKLVTRLIFSGCLLFILSLTIGAQTTENQKNATTKPVKTLSAKDKAEVIEIFQSLDANLYRLQFNGFKQTYGQLDVPGPMRSQLLLGAEFPSISEPWIIGSYYTSIGFYFVVRKPAPPAEGLEGALGKANAARLEAIVTKYTGSTTK